MTETLVDVSPPQEKDLPPAAPSAEELEAARELVRQARDRGVALTGRDERWKALTKRVSKDTVTRITDRVIEEMQAWWARPLEAVYAAVFIDAIMVKIRDGQVRNRPIYAAIGVDLDGHKDILGMWAGDGDGESAKFWLA